MYSPLNNRDIGVNTTITMLNTEELNSPSPKSKSDASLGTGLPPQESLATRLPFNQRVEVLTSNMSTALQGFDTVESKVVGSITFESGDGALDSLALNVVTHFSGRGIPIEGDKVSDQASNMRGCL
jgi:hypothetical protein